MPHVFISYSKKDVIYVRQLVEILREQGFDIWIDDRNLRSSVDWWKSIVLSIRSCSAMIIVLTPSSDDSDWVQREITLGFKYKKPIYPLWLDGSVDTPNWELFVRTQFHDVRGNKLPDNTFFEALAKHVTKSDSIGKNVTATVKIPPVDVKDDEIYLKAIEDPPSISSLDTKNLQKRLLIATVIIFIVVAVALVLPLDIFPPSLTATILPTDTGVPTIAPTDTEVLSVGIDELNQWRAAQEPPFDPLDRNDILNNLADEQGSYLYSLSLSELPNVREHYFKGVTQIDKIAVEYGYIGDVTIFVEISSPGASLTLDDVISILDRRGGVAEVHSYFTEVGLSLLRSSTTDKEYFVLILGNPNGE